MPYLIRRIQRLLEDLREGRLHFAPGVGADLMDELAKVELDSDGGPVLSTCSPSVRSTARAYSLGMRGLRPEPPPQVPAASSSEVASMNRELFDHFVNVFEGYTGTRPDRFVRDGESFGQAISRLGGVMKRRPRFGQERLQRGGAAMVELSKHYGESKNRRLGAAITTPGMKFVTADGSSTFAASALAAARSMLLYCDTLLIPDPVLAWMEVERKEEAFGHVRMLENIYHLNALAPLVRADLPYPAIVVFPSWEKSMELHDEDTRDGQEMLALNFFSHFLEGKFEDLAEVREYVRTHPSEFLSAVSGGRLLFAPGGSIEEPVPEALARYRNEVARKRAGENRDVILALSDADAAFVLILERLAPQFHARDNAEALKASPLFAQTAPWHYFQLLEKATRPEASGAGAQSVQVAAGLTASKHRWLGNVPIKDLVELRKRFENERFRDRLSKHVTMLGNAEGPDLAQAAADVERGLEVLLQEHDNEVQRITDEYARKYVGTAVTSWITLAASFSMFFPVVASYGLFAPVAALGMAAKYFSDKASERTQRAQQGRTLLGCLAAAARTRT